MKTAIFTDGFSACPLSLQSYAEKEQPSGKKRFFLNPSQFSLLFNATYTFANTEGFVK
jgi:hypothetical protein